MSSINDRLQLIVTELYNGNKASFAKAVGVPPTSVSNYFSEGRRSAPGSDLLGKILKGVKDLSATWLLTGEGEMLKSETGNEEPRKSFTLGSPYYDVDFIGGFDLVVNDQTITPKYLIDFKPYNDATCWCNVTGHSMEPEISHGDIIALKKVEDIRFLPLGEIYAIVTTNDMRTIKRIGPASDPSMYKLIPENKSPEYGEQEIPKDMVRAIYQVLGSMKKF